MADAAIDSPEEKDIPLSGDEDTRLGYLDGRYILHLDNPLPELDGAFAKAYGASTKSSRVDLSEGASGLYVLVYDKHFSIDIPKLNTLKGLEHSNLLAIHDHGRVVLATTKKECYAVVLEKSSQPSLSEIITSGMPIRDADIMSEIVPQIADAIQALGEAKIMHGRIHPDCIYYNKDTHHIKLGECVSEYCGFSQPVAFEPLERATCLPAAKGGKDFSADYFALGMTLLALITRKKAFAGIEPEQILNTRFEQGSYDSLVQRVPSKGGAKLPQRLENLLKGLLTDHVTDRWGEEKLGLWIKKDEPNPPVSTLHKQTISPFIFNEKEYYGRKYLAQDLFLHWSEAKRSIKIGDVGRWLRLGIQRSDLADRADDLSIGSNEVILTDDKITRIINILDPEGPLRFQKISVSIYGVGPFLAHCFMDDDREYMQLLAHLFTEGLIDNWINQQKDPDDFSYSNLLWTPLRMIRHLKKSPVGFGLERCLYALNPSLPCQSSLLGDAYITNLHDLLARLNELAGSKKETTDPIDRHIGAFIASKIDLSEEVRIQSIQGFPQISRHPHVLMVALLTVAQSETGQKNLKGLTDWMGTRLQSILELLNSNGIRKELKTRIKRASADGGMKELFKLVSNPAFFRRDKHGFKEARKQYRMLEMEIRKLRSQGNLEKLAYQYGLRIAVTLSYLVCISAMFYMLVRS